MVLEDPSTGEVGLVVRAVAGRATKVARALKDPFAAVVVAVLADGLAAADDSNTFPKVRILGAADECVVPGLREVDATPWEGVARALSWVLPSVYKGDAIRSTGVVVPGDPGIVVVRLGVGAGEVEVV